jgi:hypothetical protein
MKLHMNRSAQGTSNVFRVIPAAGGSEGRKRQSATQGTGGLNT